MMETDKVSEALDLGFHMMQVAAWEDFITYSYKTIHFCLRKKKPLYHPNIFYWDYFGANSKTAMKLEILLILWSSNIFT